MKDEKKLQEDLIKRFIGILIIVGAVEYFLLMVSDRIIMPFMAKLFFPGYEITESFSALALGTYIVSAFAGGLFAFLGRFIPITARIPLVNALRGFLMGEE